MSIHARSRPDTMPAREPYGTLSLDPVHDLPRSLQLPPDPDPHTAKHAGDLAERMVPVAARLVGTVRDEGHAHDIAAILQPLEDTEVHALAVVLAAMVDPDKTPRELLGWVTWDEHGAPLPPPTPPAEKPAPAERWTQPCGTHAAYNRHKTRGEHPCQPCAAAEREYQAARGRRTRANA